MIAVVVWLLISMLAFAISAQIQQAKLDDGAKDVLEASIPLMVLTRRRSS